MTLHLRPEIADGLQTIASAHGLSLEDYLQNLVERELVAIEQQQEPEGSVEVEDGIPVYRGGRNSSRDFLGNAVQRSREERVRDLLAFRS